MSFVTPSVTHISPHLPTTKRCLRSQESCLSLKTAHIQWSVCIVSHTNTGTQTGKVRRGEHSRRHCTWSEEQTIVIYVFGMTVSKFSAVFTYYLSEHKRMFFNYMTNQQMRINKHVQSHIINIIMDQNVSVTTLNIIRMQSIHTIVQKCRIKPRGVTRDIIT